MFFWLASMPLVTQAGEPGRACLWGWWPLSDYCACKCPDDYCRRTLPADPCRPPACCPDDYCRRALPLPPCSSPSCPDNYCSKCLPAFPKNCEPWYRCGLPTCATCGDQTAKLPVKPPTRTR